MNYNMFPRNSYVKTFRALKMANISQQDAETAEISYHTCQS